MQLLLPECCPGKINRDDWAPFEFGPSSVGRASEVRGLGSSRQHRRTAGAALGVLGGHVWSHVWSGGTSVEYALAGAMLAVTQRAPLTGLALTVEFARGGATALPALVVSISMAALTAELIDPSLRPHLAGRLQAPARGRERQL